MHVLKVGPYLWDLGTPDPPREPPCANPTLATDNCAESRRCSLGLERSLGLEQEADAAVGDRAGRLDVKLLDKHEAGLLQNCPPLLARFVQMRVEGLCRGTSHREVRWASVAWAGREEATPVGT